MPGLHPLDNPVRMSLLGAHRDFATGVGEVLRYPADVCPFVGVPNVMHDRSWRDAAELLGPGATLLTAGSTAEPPAGWEVSMELPGLQMTGEALTVAPDPEAVRLGPDDVSDMLALVEHARPGPFLARTIEMGNYLGIRRDGVLVAMAGERMHPPGWTEISAVCTDASVRGQGLATRLLRAVAAGVRERGELPFLHVAGTNTNAIRLYEQLGFIQRRATIFRAVRVPRVS